MATLTQHPGREPFAKIFEGHPFSGTKQRRNPKDIRKVLGRHTHTSKSILFKAMVKDLEQEKKELQEMLRERDATVATLEARNQILVEANKTLCSEIKKASKQLVRFQESRASQDRAISRIKQVTEQILGYMKELEAKIEKDKQRYEDEKKESAELERMVLDLEKICEAQENQILSLEERFEQLSFGRLEMDSLL
ncbi:myosin-10-like [Pseudonaja textilis]|uniref:myosin-10-like n=1 Tax=Pseudonaja textilis TaxID=8673 RepID=UPI000EA845AB|nr:myosin-10-like [Pseudonaja textilis]